MKLSLPRATLLCALAVAGCKGKAGELQAQLAAELPADCKPHVDSAATTVECDKDTSASRALVALRGHCAELRELGNINLVVRGFDRSGKMWRKQTSDLQSCTFP